MITSSREHPFFVEGKGFVPAGGLAIGNSIVTRAGPSLVVKDVRWNRRAEGYDVFNFVVEDDHTYFVGNSNGGAWVHNPNCNPLDLLVKDSESAQTALAKGELNVRVASAEDAEAIRQNMIVGKGYRNSTGFNGKEVRTSPELFPQGKTNTYHYDYADTQHGGMSHLQFHPPDGTIRRIFYPNGGIPIRANTWSR